MLRFCWNSINVVRVLEKRRQADFEQLAAARRPQNPYRERFLQTNLPGCYPPCLRANRGKLILTRFAIIKKLRCLPVDPRRAHLHGQVARTPSFNGAVKARNRKPQLPLCGAGGTMFALPDPWNSSQDRWSEGKVHGRAAPQSLVMYLAHTDLYIIVWRT